ncbi:hypothetical protein GQ44DRAFT_760107 [Phaeosphaeriaceae sp. PMI808]|nr:hypothetical protein GQ44DRAFT_760107 [Phaeosphaeriaceae sp. PMI808]
MQFKNLAVALSLSSAAFGAAVDNLSPGLKIRAKDAPVAASLTVAQSPVDAEKRDLEKRASGHLFVCTARDFTGTCQNLQFTTGVCFNLFSPFQDSISSAGPDNGFSCQVFTDSNCFGTFLTFTNPGIQDFNTVAPNINDQISSYRCN